MSTMTRAAALIAQYEQANDDQMLTPMEENALRKAMDALDIRKPPKDLRELTMLRPGDSFYTDDGEYHVQMYSGSLAITDITNGYRPGKTCPYIVISHISGGGTAGIDNYLDDLREKGVMTIEDLFDATKEPFEDRDLNIRVRQDEGKAKSVFNPLTLKKIKRLTKMPKKFTTDHLIKAIANGQYELLSQNFYYTDDYAMDAATNFRKADGLNPVIQLRDLITKNAEVSFSRVRENDTIEVNYGAHSNDSRTCIVNLDAEY